MSDALIKIKPTKALMRGFARWATSQSPKVRTVSINEFGVPGHLFAGLPEELLIGARVDGHAYVPVPPEPFVPGGFVAGQGESETYPPVDSVPLPEPDPNDRPVSEEIPDGVFPCEECGKEFTKARGLKMHRQQVHPDSESDGAAPGVS